MSLCWRVDGVRKHVGVEGWRPSFTNPPNMSWTELNINQKDHEQRERKSARLKLHTAGTSFLYWIKAGKIEKQGTSILLDWKDAVERKRLGKQKVKCVRRFRRHRQGSIASQPHGNTFQKHNRIEDLSQYWWLKSWEQFTFPKNPFKIWKREL